MIRFRLRERMADLSFREGRVVSLLEVAEATGLARSTLNRIANVRGYSTSTDVIDKLCSYFGCSVADLVEHLSDEDLTT
ncbi:helix-turn-helix domain-containing protein [Amnimonas aquatica]|uniref:Transcriptional regulator n=1 Tax=Amnimonas aquatica TaxID=2094561 RepID=A0A2P6ASB0_9GAMM|nr:transcriptional regulator [Amnimonas aquatica]